MLQWTNTDGRGTSTGHRTPRRCLSRHAQPSRSLRPLFHQAEFSFPRRWWLLDHVDPRCPDFSQCCVCIQLFLISLGHDGFLFLLRVHPLFSPNSGSAMVRLSWQRTEAGWHWNTAEVVWWHLGQVVVVSILSDWFLNDWFQCWVRLNKSSFSLGSFLSVLVKFSVLPSYPFCSRVYPE